MRLLLCTLSLLTLVACSRERSPSIARTPVPDSLLVRERQQNDSLARAALAEDGARLEYRWVVRADTVEPRGRPSVFDPSSRRWLTLNDTVALDLGEAGGVEVGASAGGTAVMLRLTMASGDRFLASTTQHVGSQLAVLLNGHLLSAPAPIVRTPMAGAIPVLASLDSAVATELATRLRAALPPPGRR